MTLEYRNRKGDVYYALQGQQQAAVTVNEHHEFDKMNRSTSDPF